MCEYGNRDKLRMRSLGQGENGLLGGQDEGSEVEMICSCEEKMHICPVRRIMVGLRRYI